MQPSTGQSFKFACAAAVLVAWLLCANPAHASCGYYVVSSRPSAEMLASQQAMQSRHLASQLPGKDCPCHGPQCRAGQSDAAIPVVAPVSPNDYAASLTATASLLQETRDAGAVADSSLPSEPHLLALDPPPRFHI